MSKTRVPVFTHAPLAFTPAGAKDDPPTKRAKLPSSQADRIAAASRQLDELVGRAEQAKSMSEAIDRYLEILKFFVDRWASLSSQGRLRFEPGLYVRPSVDGPYELYQPFLRLSDDGTDAGSSVRIAVARDRQPSTTNLAATDEEKSRALNFDQVASRLRTNSQLGEIAAAGVEFIIEFGVLNKTTNPILSFSDSSAGTSEAEEDDETEQIVEELKQMCTDIEAAANPTSVADVRRAVERASGAVRNASESEQIQFKGYLFAFIAEAESPATTRYVIVRRRPDGFRLFLASVAEGVKRVSWFGDDEEIDNYLVNVVDLNESDALREEIEALARRNKPEDRVGRVVTYLQIASANEVICSVSGATLDLGFIADRPGANLVQNYVPDLEPFKRIGNDAQRARLGRALFIADFEAALRTLPLPATIKIVIYTNPREERVYRAVERAAQSGEPQFRFVMPGTDPLVSVRAVAEQLAIEQVFSVEEHPSARIDVELPDGEFSVEFDQLRSPARPQPPVDDDEDSDADVDDKLLNRLRQEQERREEADEAEDMAEDRADADPEVAEAIRAEGLIDVADQERPAQPIDAADVTDLSRDGDLSTTDVADALAADPALLAYLDSQIRINNIGVIAKVGQLRLAHLVSTILAFERKADLLEDEAELTVWWSSNGGQFDDDDIVYTSENSNPIRSNLFDILTDLLAEADADEEADARLAVQMVYRREVDSEDDTDVLADGDVHLAPLVRTEFPATAFVESKRARALISYEGVTGLRLVAPVDGQPLSFLSDTYPLFDGSQLERGIGRFMYDGYVFETMRQVQEAAPYLDRPDIVNQIVGGAIAARSEEQRLQLAVHGVAQKLHAEGNFAASRARAAYVRHAQLYQEAWRTRLFFDLRLVERTRKFFLASSQRRFGVRQAARIAYNYNPRTNQDRLAVDKLYTGPDSKLLEDLLYALRAGDFIRWTTAGGRIDPTWTTRFSPSPIANSRNRGAFVSPSRILGNGFGFLDNAQRVQVRVMAMPRNRSARPVDLWYSMPAVPQNGKPLEFPADPEIVGAVDPVYFFTSPDDQQSATFRGQLNSLRLMSNAPDLLVGAGSGGALASGNETLPMRRASIGSIRDGGVPDIVVRLTTVRGDRVNAEEEVFVSHSFNPRQLLASEDGIPGVAFPIEPRDLSPNLQPLPAGLQAYALESRDPTAQNDINKISQIVVLLSQSLEPGSVTLRNFTVSRVVRKEERGRSVAVQEKVLDLIDRMRTRGLPAASVAEAVASGDSVAEVSFGNIPPENSVPGDYAGGSVSDEEGAPVPRQVAVVVPSIEQTQFVPDSEPDAGPLDFGGGFDDMLEDARAVVAGVESGNAVQAADALNEADDGAERRSTLAERREAAIQARLDGVLRDPRDNPFLQVLASSGLTVRVSRKNRIALQDNVQFAPQPETIAKLEEIQDLRARLQAAQEFEPETDDQEELREILEEKADTIAELESELAEAEETLETQIAASQIGDTIAALQQELQGELARDERLKAKRELRKARQQATEATDPVSMLDLAWPFRAEGQAPLVPALANSYLKAALESMRLVRPGLLETDESKRPEDPDYQTLVPLSATYILDGRIFSSVHEYVAWKLHTFAKQRILRNDNGRNLPAFAKLEALLSAFDASLGQVAGPYARPEKSPYQVWQTTRELRDELTAYKEDESNPADLRQLAETTFRGYTKDLKAYFTRIVYQAVRAQYGQNRELYAAATSYLLAQFEDEPVLRLIADMPNTVRPSVEPGRVGEPTIVGNLKSSRFLSSVIYKQTGQKTLVPSENITARSSELPVVEYYQLAVGRDKVSDEKIDGIREQLQLLQDVYDADLEFRVDPSMRDLEDYRNAAAAWAFLTSADSGIGSLPQDVVAIDIINLRLRLKPKAKSGAPALPQDLGAAVLVHTATPAKLEEEGQTLYAVLRKTLVLATTTTASTTAADSQLLVDMIENASYYLRVRVLDESSTFEQNDGIRYLANAVGDHPQLVRDGFKDDYEDEVLDDDDRLVYVSSKPEVTEPVRVFAYINEGAYGAARFGRDSAVTSEVWAATHTRIVGNVPVLREAPLPFLNTAELTGRLILPIFAARTRLIRVAVLVNSSSGESKQIFTTDWHPLTVAVDGRVSVLPYESALRLDRVDALRAQLERAAEQAAQEQQRQNPFMQVDARQKSAPRRLAPVAAANVIPLEKLTAIEFDESLTLDWNVDPERYLQRRLQVPSDRDGFQFVDAGVSLVQALQRYSAGELTFDPDANQRELPTAFVDAQARFLSRTTEPIHFLPENRMCSFAGNTCGLEQQVLSFAVYGAFLTDKAGSGDKPIRLADDEQLLFESKLLDKRTFVSQENLSSMHELRRAGVDDAGYIEASPAGYLDMPPAYSPPDDEQIDIVRRYVKTAVRDNSFGLTGLEVEFNNNFYSSVDSDRLTLGAFHILTAEADAANRAKLDAALESKKLRPTRGLPVPKRKPDAAAPPGPAVPRVDPEDAVPFGVYYDSTEQGQQLLAQLAFSVDQAELLYKTLSALKTNKTMKLETTINPKVGSGSSTVILTNEKTASQWPGKTNTDFSVQKKAGLSSHYIEFPRIKHAVRVAEGSDLGEKEIYKLEFYFNSGEALTQLRRWRNKKELFAINVLVGAAPGDSRASVTSSKGTLGDSADIGGQFAAELPRLINELLFRPSLEVDDDLGAVNLDAIAEVDKDMAALRKKNKSRKADAIAEPHQPPQPVNVQAAVLSPPYNAPGEAMALDVAVQPAQPAQPAQASTPVAFEDIVWNGKPSQYFVEINPLTGRLRAVVGEVGNQLLRTKPDAYKFMEPNDGLELQGPFRILRTELNRLTIGDKRSEATAAILKLDDPVTQFALFEYKAQLTSEGYAIDVKTAVPFHTPL